MRIADSHVSLSSSWAQERVTARTETLEVWVGERPRDTEARRATPAVPATPALPGVAPALPAVPATPTSEDAGAAGSGDDGSKLSPKDELDLEILRRTFRLARRLTTAADEIRRAYADEAGTAAAARELGENRRAGATSQDAGWGLAYDSTTVTTDREAVSFSAAARVTTADGRTIDAAAALSMSRESSSVQTMSLRLGDATKRVDPLVLDLGAGPAALTGRMALDLDGDGRAEETAAPGAGGAFLAQDLDANGKVDSGVELFGPATGDGFGELAALDGDGNGWVDEADAAWATLALWTPGGPLTSLSKAGIGALYTGAAATPYAVAGGAMTETGLYLRESGTAGTVRHVELDV